MKEHSDASEIFSTVKSSLNTGEKEYSAFCEETKRKANKERREYRDSQRTMEARRNALLGKSKARKEETRLLANFLVTKYMGPS